MADRTRTAGAGLSADLSRGLDEPAAAPSSSIDAGTYVNASTFFKGLVKSGRSVGIDGKFEGEIESEADVVIGREAVVHGNIKAEAVIVSGKVVGNITCSVLELQDGARVVGNLITGQLLVAMGATFRGQCFMGEEQADEEMPEPPAEQAHSGRRNRGGNNSTAAKEPSP